MIAEAEQFKEEDKATADKIAARNGLENYALSLKNQVKDEEGLGGKIDEDEKETILEAVKEATEWLEEFGRDAGEEDFEEQKERLSGVAYPVTGRLYEGMGGAEGGGEGEGEGEWDHTEL